MNDPSQVSGADTILEEPLVHMQPSSVPRESQPSPARRHESPPTHNQEAPPARSQDALDDMTVSPDVEVCRQFCSNTCGCNRANGNPCSTLFTLEHYIEMRAQCSLLTHDELDLVLMGFLSSAILDSDEVKDGRHQKPAKRKRLTISYTHHGVDVCKKTFLFLYGIGKDRLQAVKDHYKVEGLQTRQHKNSRRTPHHSMPFAAKRNVLTFLLNYAEENAILLPGRIPAHKRDDIKLLPSSCSKMVRYY